MTCLRSNCDRDQGLAQIQVLMYAFCALCTAATLLGTKAESNVHAGRVEFTSFLPENTQAAIIQPIGNDGVLVAASNTQRGFTRLDQVLSAPGSSVHQYLHAEHDAITCHKLSLEDR